MQILLDIYRNQLKNSRRKKDNVKYLLSFINLMPGLVCLHHKQLLFVIAQYVCCILVGAKPIFYSLLINNLTNRLYERKHGSASNKAEVHNFIHCSFYIFYTSVIYGTTAMTFTCMFCSCMYVYDLKLRIL